MGNGNMQLFGSQMGTEGADIGAVIKYFKDHPNRPTGRQQSEQNDNHDEPTAVANEPNKKRYMIVRQWAQYEMSSVIYAKAGSELGQTFHGHADMMMSSNAISK